jgi:hypothetical protein
MWQPLSRHSCTELRLGLHPLDAQCTLPSRIRNPGAITGGSCAIGADRTELARPFVAKQSRRHERPRDRFHAVAIGATAGAGPVRLLDAG